MSAAVEVRNATKTYKNLSVPRWKRSYRFSSALTAGAAGKSGLLEQLPVVVAVDRVSFKVPEGQIFGLIGPNGSGKSTLLRLLATLLPLDDGQIQIFGFDVTRQPNQVRRLINPIAGDASFFRKLSPLDNLLQDGRQLGLDEAETRRQVMDILTCLGMPDRFILTPMDEISTGMQQMVCLARAVLPRPRLLLLDEPTSGLDLFARRQFHALLNELSGKLGTTIVFATQDVDEAGMLCDQIAILDHGRIVALDTPEALRGSPATSLEEAFLEFTRPQPFALHAEIA